MRRSLRSIAGAAVLAISVLPGAVADAAVITPDVFTDDTTVNMNCTLREAFLSANGDVGVDACQGGSDPDTVMLPAGTYDLTVSGDGEGGANTGDLDASEDLTIQGSGAGTTVIRWLPGDEDPDRVLQFSNNGTDVTVSDLTISGGQATDGAGGGIGTTLSPSIVLNRVAVVGNRTTTASQLEGGGVAFGGTGTLTVTDSLIAENVAGGGGGGIYASGSGTLTLTNMTLSGNNALGAGVDTPGGGGAFFQGPDPTFNNATITDNDAGDGNGGGLLYADPTNVSLGNTILAGNTDATFPARPECGGFPPGGNALQSLGFNLFGPTVASCAIRGNRHLHAGSATRSAGRQWRAHRYARAAGRLSGDRRRESGDAGLGSTGMRRNGPAGSGTPGRRQRRRSFPLRHRGVRGPAARRRGDPPAGHPAGQPAGDRLVLQERRARRKAQEGEEGAHGRTHRDRLAMRGA